MRRRVVRENQVTTMSRFVTSTCAVAVTLAGALLLTGCGSQAASPAASPSAPAQPAATQPAAQPLSAGMKAAQAASQAVGQINAQSGAAADGTTP